jgi:hypothetical protein
VFDGERLRGILVLVQEPGLDEHEWITEWEALEPDLRESPVEALSEADDLISRMMEARGLPLEERDGEEVDQPETVREFVEARRITRQVDADGPLDLGDVAVAIEAYRNLYAMLLNYGPSAGSPA